MATRSSRKPKPIERLVILPLADNNNVSLQREVDHILDSILDIAGGYSKCEQDGAWKDPSTGRVYKDHSLRVYVTSESQELDERLHSHLEEWTALLRQECLYTEAYLVRRELIFARQAASIAA